MLTARDARSPEPTPADLWDPPKYLRATEARVADGETNESAWGCALRIVEKSAPREDLHTKHTSFGYDGGSLVHR